MDIAIYKMKFEEFKELLAQANLEPLGESGGPLMKCSGNKDAAWVGRWRAESSNRFRVNYFGEMTDPARIM
jgi:hypothetical protein